MNEYLFFEGVVVSLIIGSMIGLQRELHNIYNEKAKDFGGARTFSLISLVGFLSAEIGKGSLTLLATAFFVLTIILAASYILNSYGSQNKGITTELAAMATFLNGALTQSAGTINAVFVSIMILFMLNIKEKIVELERFIEKKDLNAAVLFLLMTFVILPVLPNQPIDNLGLINLYKIWLMVLFVAGISFVGYILVKVFGTGRGIGLSGFLGGIVSSTAVTLNLSRESKKSPEISDKFSVGISLASSVMPVRVIIFATALNYDLGMKLLIPLAISAVFGYSFVLYMILLTRGESSSHSFQFKNPFELKEALLLGAIFGIVISFIKLSQKYVGADGVFLVSLLSGITDVDPVVLSLADAVGSIGVQNAFYGVLLAIAANSIAKLMITVVVGTKRLIMRMATYYFIVLGSLATYAVFTIFL